MNGLTLCSSGQSPTRWFPQLPCWCGHDRSWADDTRSSWGPKWKPHRCVTLYFTDKYKRILAKLRLKCELEEEGGDDIFFPAKIIVLTFLAASLSSAVTSSLHFPNAPSSFYCLIPGCITQQNAIASVKHICIARVNSPGKQVHLCRSWSEAWAGHCYFGKQREPALESCLTFHFPWNLPFLLVSGTSCCHLLLLLLVWGWGCLQWLIKALIWALGPMVVAGWMTCLWSLSRIGCQGAVRSAIKKTSGRAKKMFQFIKKIPKPTPLW